MQESILLLWKSGSTAEEISERLECSRFMVFKTLARARRRGDPRAARRHKSIKATKLRAKIALLAQVGAKPKFIAPMLGVSRRLVEMRMKEYSP